jgi:glycosyltransferase involved in cell wall biosynthesis
MNILIATGHRNIIGGVETYLRALIPELLSRGHRVAMLYDHVGTAEKGTVDPPGVELPFWSNEDLPGRHELWHELTRWRPDVVYSHRIASTDIDRRLLESYPAVVYVHDYSGTCPTGRKSHSFPTMQPCQRTLGPMCLLLHYPRRCGGLNPLVAWKMFQQERDHNSRLSAYGAVLVASTHMYAEFSRHGVRPEMLHVVRLPLTESQGPDTPSRKIPAGRLLFVGRLTDLKGVDFLIRAMAKAEEKLGRRLTLVVAGEGAERGKLQELAHREQASVEFRGWVDPSQKMELMRQADLLVMPSLWPEPFGLAGIEAGSAGLPAAGFAAGGIPDWLLAGRTGELAPSNPPTVEGLTDAIARALVDQEHYNDLCRGAFEFSQQFTLGRHVAQLEKILSSMCSGSSSKDGRAALSLFDGR